MDIFIDSHEEIGSVQDALDALDKTRKKYHKADTDCLIFRGQADYKYVLQPNIHRYKGLQRYQTLPFENYLLCAKPAVNPPLLLSDSDLEWLMLCQHYEIPTRLLDWSSEIKTALFFACYSEDGKPKEAASPGALFVCDKNDYREFDLDSDGLSDERIFSFVNHHIKNPRMQSQSGSFMLWGNAPLDNNDTKDSYSWEDFVKEENKHFFMKKIKILPKAKAHILQELDSQYGINFDSVYASGCPIDKCRRYLGQIKRNALNSTYILTSPEKIKLSERRRIEEKLFAIEIQGFIQGCKSLKNFGLNCSFYKPDSATRVLSDMDF